MAKKGFQVLKPNHEEYVENFMALTNGLSYQDDFNYFSGPTRETTMKQVDHLLDKHAVDYPEIVIGYQLTRLEVEVVGMLA